MRIPACDIIALAHAFAYILLHDPIIVPHLFLCSAVVDFTSSLPPSSCAPHTFASSSSSLFAYRRASASLTETETPPLPPPRRRRGDVRNTRSNTRPARALLCAVLRRKFSTFGAAYADANAADAHAMLADAADAPHAGLSVYIVHVGLSNAGNLLHTIYYMFICIYVYMYYITYGYAYYTHIRHMHMLAMRMGGARVGGLLEIFQECEHACERSRACTACLSIKSRTRARPSTPSALDPGSDAM